MTLEADVKSLADRLRPINAPAADRLESLHEALAPDGEAGGWAGVDVFDALDPAGVAGDLRSAPLEDSHLAGRERLRNLLVLLPVPLTWFGLMYGAVGYSAAIAAQPSLISRPFLLLWEQGFEGLVGPPWSVLSFLTFSHIAVGDVVVLLLVLLLTWQIHTEVNVRQAARERSAREIETSLHQIAWSAALVFAGRTSPRANDDRSRQVLEALLDELRAERERGAQVTSQREREAADLRTFGSEFRIGAQDLRRVTGEVGQTFDAMLNVTASLDDRLAGLASDQTSVHESLAQLAAGLERFYEIQRHATSEMVATSHDLARIAEQAVASASSTAAGLQGVDEALVALSQQNLIAAAAQVEAARVTGELFQQSAGAMTGLQQASVDVRGVLNRLHDIAPSLLAAAERQSESAITVSQAVREFLGGVQRLSKQLGVAGGKPGQNPRWLWIFPRRDAVHLGDGTNGSSSDRKSA